MKRAEFVDMYRDEGLGALIEEMVLDENFYSLVHYDDGKVSVFNVYDEPVYNKQIRQVLWNSSSFAAF